MPDISELTKFRDERLAERKKELTLKSLPLLYPVANVEKLIGDPRWDTFRTLIQGKLEQLRKSLSGLEGRLLDPKVLDGPDLAYLKHNYVVVRAQVDAFEIALRLPEELIRDVKSAEAALSGESHRQQGENK